MWGALMLMCCPSCGHALNVDVRLRAGAHVCCHRCGAVSAFEHAKLVLVEECRESGVFRAEEATVRVVRSREL